MSVIIPTLNEAANLPHVLPRIPADVDEIIIVDGFSTDGTVQVARSLRSDLRILYQEGRGKGAALRTGISAATGDALVMLDADGSTDPAEIPLFIAALCDGADLVKGSRFVRGGGSTDMSGFRRIGNRGFVTLANLLFGTAFTDITYGYRAVWRVKVDTLALEIDGWANEIVGNIRAEQCGLRVVEIASFEHCRVAGESKLRPLPAGWAILTGMLRERLKRHRLAAPSPAVQLPPVTLGVARVPGNHHSADGEHRWPSLRVSVVICAYTVERWADICAALRSALDQNLPAREIVVVVDYNEPLLAHIRELAANEPSVVVVRNTCTRGLSGARNSGVRIASGDIIAFLDDDAEAAPDWLAQLVAGYADERVLGVGGAIVPRFAGGQPQWFPEEFNWVLGCTYRGLPPTASPVRNFIGANMSFRRDVFETIGGFRPSMGRVGLNAVPVGGEETELCIRARKFWPDGVLLYDPRAVVNHKIPVRRASWGYFWLRCLGEGKTKAALANIVGGQHGLASERVYTLRVLPRGVASGLADGLLRGESAGFARAVAIVAGWTVAAAGYAVSMVLRGGKAAISSERSLEDLVPVIRRATVSVTRPGVGF